MEVDSSCTSETPSCEDMESNHSEPLTRVQNGSFRRAKSTPSLTEEEGRRGLWGWGKRPNLPPQHFYYIPHAPPRNRELKHEDIPEGADRVKRIKERMEKALEGGTKEDAPKVKKERAPYRTPSFGGSTIQVDRCSTLPHGAKKIAVDCNWRSTLPRNGDLYWNGISTKANRNKSGVQQDRASTEEVRVSRGALERIRAKGTCVTYYGGKVVKMGSPADPTHVIMEEIRKQREQEEDVGLVEDLNGALKALGRLDWSEGRQDSSYGSAESTPVGTPGAPTPPPPPSPPLAKVVSTVAKKGDSPSWSGKCSVVFDFRKGGMWENGERVCF